MQPVVIFRHSPTEGPGYFATFLESRRIPWRLIAVDAGDVLPSAPEAFSGLAFMGGPMSVNDALPWIDQACTLIRSAVDQGIPVIGHCLGGQLMSKALGGTVTLNRVKEIGWGTVTADPGAETQHWLGPMADEPTFSVFQWHGETFSLPPGATRLLYNEWCDNQTFVSGPHLAMQCHVEMTRSMIERWCESWHDEVTALAVKAPCVQTPKAMQEEIDKKLPAMRRLADQLYARWVENLGI